MTARIFAAISALLLALAAAFFIFAPGIVEGRMNRIEGPGQWPVSDSASRLHGSLTVVDLHADTLLWSRSLLDPATRGHVDLPRLQRGGVALQIFSSVTKTPRGQNYDSNDGSTDNITLLAIAQLQPPRTWTSLTERSLYHAEKLERAVRMSEGSLWQVKTTQGLDNLLAARRNGQAITGALLSTEGAHNLEGRLENLDRLHAAGFRMMGLVHFFDNEAGGSMHGRKKGGLTDFGRKLVPAMEDKGIIVDLAHASRATFMETLAMARRPVVVSHGGIKATCDSPRNLDNEQLLALKANGGIIGIGYWEAAVCGTTPAHVARAIKAAIDIMGPAHVALGSDFDGAVTTGLDAAHVDAITQALIDQGLPTDTIDRVMGANALRIIREGLKPFAQLPPPDPAPLAQAAPQG